ncbi:uncharacterized protein LOC117652252 isoform X2 [Thrips palmi]|uniref:Uncharacterized protein LOC117652252 isoform X2 n=1 Tax=Thrips palmi TaxID=161013 RepID=A0A6P9A4P0_THRPL|nr:uncharacterized protein LOC117652252 isoform X2 [Thrips palmi]
MGKVEQSAHREVRDSLEVRPALQLTLNVHQVVQRPFVTMSLTLNLRAALKWAGKKVQNYMNQRVEEVFGLPLETFLKAVGYASSVVCLAAVVVLLVVLVCMGDQESIDVAVRLDGDLCKSFKCHALTFAAPVVSVLNHVALYHVWIRVFGYSMYDFYHGNLRHTKALEDFSTLSPFFIMVMIFEFSYGFLLSINVHLGMQQCCTSTCSSSTRRSWTLSVRSSSRKPWQVLTRRIQAPAKKQHWEHRLNIDASTTMSFWQLMFLLLVPVRLKREYLL